MSKKILEDNMLEDFFTRNKGMNVMIMTAGKQVHGMVEIVASKSVMLKNVQYAKDSHIFDEAIVLYKSISNVRLGMTFKKGEN